MRTERDQEHSVAAARETMRAARVGLAATIERGADDRMREQVLPRLVAVAPEEIADRSRDGHLAMVRRILTALRGERTRGRAGHWSYSLDRHIGLVQALAAERRALAELDRAGMRRGASAPRAVRMDAAGEAAQTKTAADHGPRRS